MSLDRIIDITTTLAPPASALANFSVPLVASILTAPQGTAWTSAYGSALTAEVTKSNYVATLTALGITSSEDVYVALVDMFSQDDWPALVLLGRRATAVAQVTLVNITGTDDGDYTVTINGTDFTYTASGATADTIEAQLISAVNAGSEPVTAAPGTGDQLTLTADEAGVPFTVSVTNADSNLNTAVDTASVGLPEDIAAWNTERSDWYILLETTRTDGNIQAAAEAIETTTPPKLFIAQTNDPNGQVLAATSDLGYLLGPLGLNLERTALVWHGNDDEFLDAALVGKNAPKQPGSVTWANKVISSITPTTPTSDTTLAAKRYTWLEAFEAAGSSMTQGGQVCSGEYIDIIIGRDWLNNLMQIAFYDLFRSTGKLGYQNSTAVLEATLRGVLARAAAPDVQLIEASSVVVNVPAPGDQLPSDVSARHYPGITWSATLTGAIHSVEIDGRLAAAA